jgi:hypothetical protein
MTVIPAGSAEPGGGGGDAGVTVIVDVPVLPSLVAVSCTLPATSAVTRPAAETPAMLGLAELQVMTRPVSTLLLASRVTAESCWVAPTCTLALEGETVTDATGAGAGAVTVTGSVPLLVSLDAVIIALPAALAVTIPDAETVLMALLLELQAIARPVNTLLLASRVTADSCIVAPTKRLGETGATETDATGTGAAALTTIVAMALFPSLVTVICVVPAPTAVTRPSELTDATAGFALDEVTTRPVSTLLLASNAVTWSWTVAPIRSVDDAGDTDTVATGAGGGVVEAVVVAETTFERLPYTALRFIVPRNGTSWKP